MKKKTNHSDRKVFARLKGKVEHYNFRLYGSLLPFGVKWDVEELQFFGTFALPSLFHSSGCALGVPCFSPDISWNRLQHRYENVLYKWMDMNFR